MIEILKLNGIENKMKYEDALLQIQFIFYASSSLKEFSSPERKQAFFQRWCGDYILHYPDQFFIMCEDKKILGYMSLCKDSSAAMSVLSVPGYNLFSDLFQIYPAHLHINFHPDCRGRGLGSQLVEHCCTDLVKDGIFGIHLVTSPGALNIPFYKRLGFQFESFREFNKAGLLFMGKILE